VPRHATPLQLARLAATLAALLGLLVLAGWALGIGALKSVVSGAVEMKANTAVGLVLAGVALFISACRSLPIWEFVSRTMALIVAALGLVTLSQYVFHRQLGIDELLFRDMANAFNAIPGRMSPYSAVALFAIGIALWLLAIRRLWMVVWLLSGLVACIGLVSLLGYAWGARELVTDDSAPPVALHAALAFALLGELERHDVWRKYAYSSD